MNEPLTLDTELIEKYLRAVFARDYLRASAILAMSSALNRTLSGWLTELLATGQLTRKDFEEGVTVELAKQLLN